MSKNKPTPDPSSLEHRVALTTAQRETLVKALQSTHGNVSAAAGVLKLSRAQTNRLIKKHDLQGTAAALRLKAGQGSMVKFGSRAGQVLGAKRKAKTR